MYKQDPQLDIPNNNQKIWRYMGIWKFMDMLSTSTLHCTRVDCLDDTQEGSWEQFGVFDAYKSMGPEQVKLLEYWNKVYRTIGAVNCWHVNESESQQMWDEYVCQCGGVAITSTFNDLREVIKKTDTSGRIATIGMMKYKQFQQNPANGFGTFLDYFTYKHKDFKHENELRVLILAMGIQQKPGKKIPKEGLKLEINLNDLISEVYVYTGSQSWKLDLICRLVSDYNLNVTIEPSQFNISED